MRICRVKQRPKREPKFHQAEMFDGEGRSINASLMIFNKGCRFRRAITNSCS